MDTAQIGDLCSIQQALWQAKEKLQSMADNAMLEAEILLAQILNESRSFLYAEASKLLSTEQLYQFTDYVTRRYHGEPIAYIIGKKEFWSLMLSVSPDVLIPRPETELLVETALVMANTNDVIKVADLGTGSGAIALALARERSNWQLYATDQSARALQIANKNAQDLEINNISFHEGNWCTALPCNDFNMVISNPPYIALTEWEDYAAGLAYEPKAALVSGQDGLDAIRIISREARLHMKSGGYLLIEHGYLHAAAVCNIFEQDGYTSVRSIRDLAGHERVTIGRV